MSTVSRPEKILLAMNELAQGSKRALKYEDIVVKSFEMFPEDFQLRGYRQYPDASDIHKPLYGPLKRQGFVKSANKTFSLTELGLAHAAKLSGGGNSGSDRLERATESELKRIADSEAFRLFIGGKSDRILDTDFYGYLNATVRTPRNDFLSRLSTVEAAVSEGKRLARDPKHDLCANLHEYITNKFAPIIERKRNAK